MATVRFTSWQLDDRQTAKSNAFLRWWRRIDAIKVLSFTILVALVVLGVLFRGLV